MARAPGDSVELGLDPLSAQGLAEDLLEGRLVEQRALDLGNDLLARHHLMPGRFGGGVLLRPDAVGPVDGLDLPGAGNPFLEAERSPGTGLGYGRRLGCGVETTESQDHRNDTW
jgi:hypothetical protein